MDFIMGYPKTSKGFNVLWMIVDRLTKSTHFLSIELLTRWTSWHSYMWMRFCVFLLVLCLTQILDLSLDFREVYNKLWELSYVLPWISIFKLMDNLRGLSKH